MRLVRAAAWVILLVVGSVAAAGLVLALDHPPTAEGRPELTAADAAVLAGRVRDVEAHLAAAGAAASDLAASGREVLLRLRALDLAGVADALLAGDVAAGELAMAAAEVRAVAPDLLVGLDGGRRLSATDRERAAAIAAVPDAAGAAVAAWPAVGTDVDPATRYLAALRDHDAAVARAAARGRAGDYEAALGDLGVAEVARRSAEEASEAAAAAGREVGAATALASATADHDRALLALYRALLASGGVRTSEVDGALAAEAAARDALPAGQGPLVAAVTALGGGGVTEALLRIEDARRTLAAALPSPSASPGGGPG